jgi:hypothetical protein
MNYHIQLFQILCFLMFYLQSLILHILIWDNLLIIFTFNLLSICFLHYFEFTTLPIPSSFVANLSSNFHNQCIYLCCLLYQHLHLVLRNPKLVTPSLKLFQITRCYTSHRCFSVFLMSSNLPFTAQQFLIQPG